MRRFLATLFLVLLLAVPAGAELVSVREYMESCRDPRAVDLVVEQLREQLDPDGWSPEQAWDSWAAQPSSLWYFFFLP